MIRCIATALWVLLPLLAANWANVARAQPAYANAVVSVQAGSGPGHPNFDDPMDILGPPNYVGEGFGIGAFSLGVGGRIIARLSHAFAGDGSSAIDLNVYEIGTSQGGTEESALVEVSADAMAWLAAGSAPGGKSEIDLDAYGLGPGAGLRYVRLTDTSLVSGQPAGVDIDAIEAVRRAANSADFDDDGDVDGGDFITWQRGLGLAPAIHSQGDADYNEQVNALDIAIWRDQFGAGMSAAVVPEPAAARLVGLGALWVASALLRGRAKRASGSIEKENQGRL
jgi:hypothetical protein